VTLFLAELDVAAARLTYLNAGHNPGLVVRSEGRVEPLPSCGLPIGLLLQGSYAMASLDLAPGDLVCLYSDGITECASPGEEEFGGERLSELLLTQRSAPLPDLVRAIDEAVTRFGQGLPQGDDQTVVLLRRHA
jgi:phosphoserine phosphatase RsbU/P